MKFPLYSNFLLDPSCRVPGVAGKALNAQHAFDPSMGENDSCYCLAPLERDQNKLIDSSPAMLLLLIDVTLIKLEIIRTIVNRDPRSRRRTGTRVRSFEHGDCVCAECLLFHSGCGIGATGDARSALRECPKHDQMRRLNYPHRSLVGHTRSPNRKRESRVEFV